MGDPGLPLVSQLLDWQLEDGEILRVHSRDLKDMYYQFAVPSARWPSQAIGPRVPESWFQSLDDLSLDMWDDSRDDRWLGSDLRPGGADTTWHTERPGLVQPTLIVIMMGDLYGVTAAQRAHVHGLQSANLLPDAHRLCGLRADRDLPWLRDVYIDDVGHLQRVSRAEANARHGQDFDDMADLDRFYEARNIPQSVAKAIHGAADRTALWGAEIHCIAGTVAAPLWRRICTCCLGLLWAAGGAKRGEAEAILGCLATSFLFRRELFACCGSIYKQVRSLPVSRRTRLSGESGDDVVAASFLQLCAVSSLRAPLSPWICASDASLFAGGATWTEVPAEVAASLALLFERRGMLPCLSRKGFPDDVTDVFGQGLSDHRDQIGRLLARAPWKTVLFFQFRCHSHINVKELRALIRLVARLASAGCRDCRVIIGLDSTVALGAAAKGRSSSVALNRHLRRLAATCLTHGLRLLLCWLPSKLNPSDAPSRLETLDSWRAALPADLPDWSDVVADLTRRHNDRSRRHRDTAAPLAVVERRRPGRPTDPIRVKCGPAGRRGQGDVTDHSRGAWEFYGVLAASPPPGAQSAFLHGSLLIRSYKIGKTSYEILFKHGCSAESADAGCESFGWPHLAKASASCGAPSARGPSPTRSGTAPISWR